MSLLAPEWNYAPGGVKNIHIMGICGTGMAALAGMLQQSGFAVRGSDSQVYPPMSDFLKGLKIPVSEGYRPENLEPRPDLVIVGNVIAKKNPEAQHLATLPIPYLSFPQALAEYYISSRTSLVVAGTHGKTTTCSLLATALHRANYDPTFMIGGFLKEFEGNFRVGQGEYFVAEGDEYDTAFFDKESKFLHYRPKVAIITSLEFDHADIFSDLDAIKRSFQKFVALLPEDGLLVANLDDPNVCEVVRDAACSVQGYGKNQTDWSLRDITSHGTTTSFTAWHQGEFFGEFSLPLPGEHNCCNALAVIAVLHSLGLDAATIHQGVRTFAGVKRRQEVRGVAGGVTVIDDFAHHPTAVAKTIQALHHAYPEQRLVVVFEPRTNTSRRSIFQQQYAVAFDGADLICLREPVPLKTMPEDGLFSSAQLAEDLRQDHGLAAHSFATTDAILDFLGKTLRSGDVVAVLSNGGFDDIHRRLLTALSAQTA